MIYEKTGLKIKSDFEIKEIQKDKQNIDLIIPIEDRCVNIYFDNLPKYINSRIQFPMVKKMFFRFCIIENNNICTIHLLNDSGIHSSIANFEIDYSTIYIEVSDKEFFVDIKFCEKQNNWKN
ncbi:MAG TPA: hypothetical protein VIM70_20745 [Clostridium sp.]|uniref:hypothetical protein n=1 Tax=Clostridium sp. TaxID=1506 RepID=UPI002F93EDC1